MTLIKTTNLIFISFLLSNIFAQLPDGNSLIDQMINSLEIDHSYSLIEQINHYSDGSKRSFQLEMFSGNRGEESLMRYLKPASVKGQSFLIKNNGNEIWTFSQRTRRVRKLASHFKKQKVQGSDFSFEDLSSQEIWKDNYNSKTLSEIEYSDQPCWLVQSLKFENSDEEFSKVETYLRKSDYYPLLINYYTDDNTLEKSLELSDIKVWSGVVNAGMVIMKNHITGTSTSMKTIEFDPKWKPDEDFFSERSLKK